MTLHKKIEPAFFKACNLKDFFIVILLNIYEKNVKILRTILLHFEKVIYSC